MALPPPGVGQAPVNHFVLHNTGRRASFLFPLCFGGSWALRSIVACPRSLRLSSLAQVPTQVGRDLEPLGHSYERESHGGLES